MTNRKQWILLGGLLLLWMAVLAFRVMSEPEPQRVPLKFVSGQVVTREAARSADEMPVGLRTVGTQVARVSFKDPKNIFAPLDLRTDEEKTAAAQARLLAARKKTEQAAAAAAPAPPAPPPPTPEELAAQEAQRQIELARQQKEQAVQQARKAMGQYRFLGYLTRNGAPQAFLGKGNEIYIVKTGETVEGKIQVTTIDVTTVKLTEQTTSTEASLPLVKEGS
jgi:type IV secretory pathway VirB10-like protein